MKKTKTAYLTLAALFSALAYLTVFVFRIPFIPAVGWLKFEAKDCVIALESLILGPSYGVMTSLIVSLLEMVTISDTGPIGALMNFLSTCSFVLPVGLMYKYKKSAKTAVIGLCFSVVLTTALMLMWNYFITPLYLNTPRELIVPLLLPGFLPFNLIKYTINACLTYILYKPLITVLRKSRMLPESSHKTPSTKGAVAVYIICSIVVLASIVGAIVISIK
ncbi:MAG: ECF transporter S component [Oscillospiraceae bacterium]|nr:ECF transporter S component [Oscillospiraceae bacterium]